VRFHFRFYQLRSFRSKVVESLDGWWFSTHGIFTKIYWKMI